LQNVGVYFPHYSRHDESHSRQILVHIERLLGPDNIAKLSPTDTWLLLEAVYLHDIGMIISDEQLKEDYDAIKKHVEKAKYSANGDVLTVMNALLASKEKTASSIFASVDISPFQAIKLLREIIADFYRAQHPDRADKIIPNPFDEIGLNSPRNELLPARFFSLLGRICAYHGDSFDKVMELPKQQVGIGTDDCHPRFIACSLRLGDLLDLDDNRFCPVMMKVAGKLPELSESHRQKHLAIRHFRADPDHIEIEAECPDYESYIETTKWFGWLRDEVKNQMSRWFDIVPERSFGLLPSVGDLKAHLKDWQVFSENQRPHFELDREKVIGLLQGAGLYESKEQAMRELLQNAVDATLIRIWREYNETYKKGSIVIKETDEPRSENVRNIFKKFPIEVTIEKDHCEEEFNYWRITIIDKGTGISRKDLFYISQIGGSVKNIARREIIEKMPVWMRPSGIFGIGLQSAFLLTDEVIINTRSIDTGETLEIKLTNPTGKEKGNIYFRTSETWNFSDYGTKLEFIYKSDKNTGSVRWTDGYSSEALKRYDELVDIEQDFNILNICEGVKDFFYISFLNGTLDFSEYSINEKFIPTLTEQAEDIYYSASDKLELIELTFSYDSNLNYYYRGQHLDEHSDLSFNFLKVAVNLLDEKADEIVTINRNKFKKDTRKILFERISNAVQSFFKTPRGKLYYDNLDCIEQAIVAAEYELMNWKTPDYFNINWDEFLSWTLIDGQKVGMRIKQLEEAEAIILYSNIKPFFEKKSQSDYLKTLSRLFKSESNNTTKYKIEINRINSVFPLVNKFLAGKGFTSEYSIFESENIEALLLNKEEKQSISSKSIQWYCIETFLKKEVSLFSWRKRETIPCLSNYNKLALKVEPYKQKSTFKLDGISPRMLFPLAKISGKITVGDLDKLVDFVYKNRADEKVTEEQIRQKYQEFIAFLDDLMKDDEKWKQLRGSEFNPAPTENHSHGG